MEFLPPSAPALHFGSYAPGVSYHGDQAIGEGLAGLGSGLAQGIAMYNQNKRQHETRDATFDFLAQKYPELIPPEALERYHSANENQKNKWMLQAYTAYTDKIRQDKMTSSKTISVHQAPHTSHQSTGSSAPTRCRRF